jgi:hypothetical protein
MSNKGTNIPSSDVNARRRLADLSVEKDELPLDNMGDLQTSNKQGSHSTVEKLADSRGQSSARPWAQPVDGAFGYDEPDPIADAEDQSSSG